MNGRTSRRFCRSRACSRTTTSTARTAGSISSIRVSSRRSSSDRLVERLLPVEPSEDTEGIPGNQFIFEPSPDAVLRELLPRYVATRVYQAALELTASFYSAQMVAMKNATENAQDLIEDLTLTYNKVRQANITSEMIEIATGAQAQ